MLAGSGRAGASSARCACCRPAQPERDGDRRCSGFGAADTRDARIRISPLARQRAAELGVDVQALPPAWRANASSSGCRSSVAASAQQRATADAGVEKLREPAGHRPAGLRHSKRR
jgi:pyruvate/2-oxoglutarate dehydrogenase complex dihydrolipoamide acyltransferase (E2) component